MYWFSGILKREKMSVNINFIGVILAIIFTLSMSGLILWMLRVPPPIPPAAAKARRSVGAIKRILVPTVGMPYSERGIELACRLGEEQKAEIILVYVVEVPRTLPLNAPLPTDEINAKEALDRGKEIVELRELNTITKMERAREAWEGIIRSAKDYDVDLIVMGVMSKKGIIQDILGKTADILFKKAPFEIIIDRLPS